ncbi:MAG: hypothetical protein WA269_00205 [Candidatus Udaeobacter sp.]
MKTRLTTVLSVALATAIPLIDADIAAASGFVVRREVEAGILNW